MQILFKIGTLVLMFSKVQSLQGPIIEENKVSRRKVLTNMIAMTLGTTSLLTLQTIDNNVACAIERESPPNLNFIKSSSGLQYADAKIGTGQPITTKGSNVAIDYVMSTTGARYGTKIYSTADKNAPYRFQLGDGTTIQGIELAIAGDGNTIEPMRPGGVRRVIIPSNLAYESLAAKSTTTTDDCKEGKGIGPIPPTDEGTTAEYYQRFKNIYCNPNRPYQPDLVMDIKLYGKR